MSKKLLVFSDCYIYGGSERLMSFLIKNEILNQRFEIKFAFRNHRIYKEGMFKDFQNHESKLLPLNILSNDTLFYKINSSFTNKLIRALLKVPLWILRKIGFYSLYNAFIFFRLLKNENPDVLHINNGGFPAAASCNLLVFIARMKDVKRIIYQVNNQAQKRNVFNALRNRKISDYVSSFITSSKMAKKNLAKNAGIDINKIAIVRNIVQSNVVNNKKETILDAFGLNSNTFIMVNVAFLTPRKGQIFLLKALKKWVSSSEKKIDFCLFLIGDGEDDITLKQYCKTNNLDKNIHFLGYQSSYADYINAANLLVFPSISNEDLPLVIIESLMLGKCILATALAGITEVIEDGKNGVLVQPNTETLVDELAKKIFYLFSNPSEVEILEYEAKSSAVNFSEEIYGKSLSQIYEQ